MLKKLDIFLLKSYAGPLVATFFISLFVLLMQFLWKYIDDLVGKGLDASVVAELMFYASISLIPMALPLAILLASIMTFGNLGEKFELTAIKAAGISIQRTMRPLFFTTLAISLGAFYVANNLIPLANLKMSALLWSIKQQRPELSIKPHMFNNDIENFSIRISSKDPITNMMYDFVVYDHTPPSGNGGSGDNRTVIVADSGMMKMTENSRYMIVTLYNGIMYEEEIEKVPKNYPRRKDEFSEQTFVFDLSNLDFSRTDENLFKNNYQVKDVSELARSTDSLQNIFSRRTDEFLQELTVAHYLKASDQPVKKFADSVNATRRQRTYWNPSSGYNELSEMDERMMMKDSAFLREDSAIRGIITHFTDSVFNGVYSISPENMKIVVDLDSVYENMSRVDRLRLLETTKQYVNETQQAVVTRCEDFADRRRLIAKYRNAWHQKFTLSFACMIFFFIGAPLGAIIRKGGFGLPIVVSIAVFIVYYMISTAGMKMARDGMWESWQGMWLSSVVILPFGVFLTYKATVDAPLFESDFWKKMFAPIINIFKKKKAEDTDAVADRLSKNE